MGSTQKGNQLRAMSTHLRVGLFAAVRAIQHFLAQGRLRYYALLLAFVGGGAAYVTVAAHPGSVPVPLDTSDGTSPHASSAAQTNHADAPNGNGSSTSDSSGGHTSNSVSITLNGRTFHVPADGELHKDISDDNGSTTIDVSHDSSGSNSSIDIEYNSSSTTSAGGDESD